ncbi:MAG: ribonuclease H-like YkuK family protein [Candidatus Portnoybacteria bacterium]|nr:ribonuclease H-like YkuK family protein [Candidatus Portnoybacteria bacterium]
MKQKDTFLSPTQGRMELTKVAKEISSYINQDSQRKYRLIVGTDSNGDKQADFVTAIIVCRVGRGGRYFWKKTNGNKTFHTIRDRIYQEVTLSLQTAQDILGQLKSSLKPNQQLDYDFQIHIDVGQRGPTREMIKEVVGMVRGNGFKAKIKPESFAASSVADKYA